jgi:hypothetical protein
MEAPKRIWAEPRFEREYQRHVWDGVACHWKSTPRRAKDGPSQEYIRADVVEAMVAEERERYMEAQGADSGMTLRDWFAGQALMGLLAFDGFASPDPEDIPAQFARSAYRLADAILKERNR